MQTSNANIIVTIDRLVICPCVDVWCRLKVSTTSGKASEN